MEASYVYMQARLDSFEPPAPAKSRRTSSRSKKAPSKASKAKAGWPLAAPSAQDLAYAGFVWKPTSTSPDNVQCFACNCQLDGWEESDVPAYEHATHSPSCGFAVVTCIRLRTGDPDRTEEDPLSEQMLQARRDTFGTLWPLDSAAGYPSVEQMVAAGWYYDPTEDTHDGVTCPYCSLSLDAWDAGDDALEEHRRRASDCLFFVLNELYHPPPKPESKKNKRASTRTSSVNTKVKKAAPRAPKASRETSPEISPKIAPKVAPKTDPKVAPKVLQKASPVASLEPSPVVSLEPSPVASLEPSPAASPEPSPVVSPEPSQETSPGPSPKIAPKIASKSAPKPATKAAAKAAIKAAPKTAPKIAPKASPAPSPESSPEPSSKVASKSAPKAATKAAAKAAPKTTTKAVTKARRVSTRTSNVSTISQTYSNKRASEDIEAPEETSVSQKRIRYSSISSLPESLPAGTPKGTPPLESVETESVGHHEMPSLPASLPFGTPKKTPTNLVKIEGTPDAELWQPIDIDDFFGTAQDVTGFMNDIVVHAGLDDIAAAGSTSGDLQTAVVAGLTEAEKQMTVEQWVLYNAKRGEEKLRMACEKQIVAFEAASLKALTILESIPTY